MKYRYPTDITISVMVQQETNDDGTTKEWAILDGDDDRYVFDRAPTLEPLIQDFQRYLAQHLPEHESSFEVMVPE